MLAFGLTIFTSAFLLFLVQPLIARFILPWFGGTPAVWTTCMLFFQVLLVGGYGYAHWSIARLKPRTQVLLHLGVLAAALLLLPITPGDPWKPLDGSNPLGRILLLLTACLGLPYLVLSATGPLMQAWFSRAFAGVAPYRLYALSNVGSLLALMSYPFLVEPNFSRRTQVGGWSLGLVVFALLAAWCGLIVWRRSVTGAGPEPSPGEVAGEVVETTPGIAGARGLWFMLPACASVLLLAVTNKICQDIAVVPFLWVMPLSLYLLSFIISFDSPRWYRRWFWLPALALSLGSVVWLMTGLAIPLPQGEWFGPVRWFLLLSGQVSMFKTIGIYLVALFVCCMVCHGELFRLRPAAQKLTAYYLVIAAGGAFGGLLVAVVSPLLFDGFWELHLGLFSMGVLAAVVLLIDPASPLHRGRRLWAWAPLGLGIVALGFGLRHDTRNHRQGTVEVARNFYGVLAVEEHDVSYPDRHHLLLRHGGTTHGLQYLSADKRQLPSSYYTPTSGIGRTMRQVARDGGRHVGVVGLGTGTMAAWGRLGDRFRFYEINRSVQELAMRRFSYLADSAARVVVVPGDARLTMEREPAQAFDILVLDAFSSDAIPVHLLTREAFEIYQRHLKPDGVLAVHISNHHLDLKPLVARAAEQIGFGLAMITDDDRDPYEEEENAATVYGSDWALLSRNPGFLNDSLIAEVASPSTPVEPGFRMWTDEESSLFRVLVMSDDGWLGWLRRRLVGRP